MPILISILFVVFFSFANLQAQSIVLRDARDSQVPIAVQRLVPQPADSDSIGRKASDIEAMLTANLIFARIFRVIPAEAFVSAEMPETITEFNANPWRQAGATYVVRAQVLEERGHTVLNGYVFDVNRGNIALQQTYRTRRDDFTVLAHQFGDSIVELVTGSPGLFSTKIAYVYQPPGSNQKEIWAMDFNGRNSVPLVQNNRVNLSPTWTKDGRSIVYTSASTVHWNLWRTTLQGRSTQLTSEPGSALGPAMHPNGRDMVVSLSRDGFPELYMMDINGNIKERLTRRRDIDIAPSMSPDGNRVCFSSGRLGALHVFVLNLVSKEVDRLTRVGTLNDSCAWHPTENRILFSGMDVDREFDIFAMDDKGNNMERLTFDARHNETPDWSPDGRLIVFSSRRTGRSEIFIMNADGTGVEKITDLPGQASHPTWSPRLGY